MRPGKKRKDEAGAASQGLTGNMKTTNNFPLWPVCQQPGLTEPRPWAHATRCSGPHKKTLVVPCPMKGDTDNLSGRAASVTGHSHLQSGP